MRLESAVSLEPASEAGVPEQLSYAAIEADLGRAREGQRMRVEALQSVELEQQALRRALDGELLQLRRLSTEVRRPAQERGLWAALSTRVSALFGAEAVPNKSVQELLHDQYEHSSVRLRQAAELADRLERIQSDLYDEVESYNARCLTSARFEDSGAETLLTLKAQREAVLGALAGAREKSEKRELEVQADRLRRQMAELSTQVKLHRTRDERLSKLKKSTELVAQTISNLASDMRQYVSAAGEKLDLIATQVQAVGAAADASAVLVDLKNSLDTLTDSVNEATRFVTEVQSHFHQHMDEFTTDMELYDEETIAQLEINQEFSQLSDERRIEEGLQFAQQHAGRTRVR